MSKHDQWMPLYIGDYLRDTGHLSTAEHGAYVLLLMQAWTRGGALPSDPEKLRNLARMEKKEWRQSRATLLAFFTLDGDTYRQKRLDREIARAAEVNEQRKTAGKASAEARKRQRQGNVRSTDVGTSVATDVPTEGEREAQQTGRPLQPHLEREEPSLRSGQAGPASPPPDARTMLFREGLGRLRRLTGKPEGPTRALLGRLLRDAGDDAAALTLVLTQAEAERPADPVPWIVGALAARTQPRALIRSGKPSNLDWMLDNMPRNHHA